MRGFIRVTIKIQSYQKKGIKQDKLVEEWEFCCWETLFKWLAGYSELNKCPRCKKEDTSQHSNSCECKLCRKED